MGLGFGIGEVLASAEEAGIGYVERIGSKLGLKDLLEGLKAMRQRLWLVILNSVIGFWFGVLPGHGATAGSFLGYGIARQYSKNKENFGKGEISGIMGPQSAADASAVGSLVPMLALGVPGSPTSAVMMAGLFIWGLQPGPLLFVEQREFVWGFIASIYLGHLLTFLLCLAAVPLLASIMRAPYGVVTPFILIISVIGAYSINTSMKDAEIARATYHEPEFRADVKKDRRGTLSRYKTVQHALRDRAASDGGETGKAAKKPR